MGISLVVTGNGFRIAVNLKDSAMEDIWKVLKEHRDEGTVVTQETHGTTGPVGSAPTLAPALVASETGPFDPVGSLKGMGAAELLNQINWGSFAEKILLLGSWHEARGGASPWKSSDIDSVFGLAKETKPRNLSRDISTAISEGWVHAVSARSYTITRTGWNKVGAALAAMQPKAP